MPEYLINYDNGVNDCGTFPWVYTDYDKACRDAEDIADENIADGSWGPEGGCEVIEKPGPRVPGRGWGPPAHQIEGTIDHFDRYITGDR